MAIGDLIEGVKIAKEQRLQKAKTKALSGTAKMIDAYAENAVSKFKTEYFIQSSKGKRNCTIHTNPYPDAVIMKKVLAKVSKKEYLVEFEKALKEKMEAQGFPNMELKENFLNAKEPVTIKVKW